MPRKSKKPTLSTKVAKIEKMMRKDKPESKAISLPILRYGTDPLPVITAGTGLLSYPLTQIAQGDLVGNRQGDEIVITSVSIKGELAIGTTSSLNAFGLQLYNNCVQLFLVEDSQTVADQTTVAYKDIWDDTYGEYYNPAAAERSIVSRGRYKILEKSHIIWLNRLESGTPAVAGVAPTMNPNFHLFHRFKAGLRVRYNAGGVADIQKRGLFFVATSNYVSPNGPAPYLKNLEARVNFTDV